jgi:hypothetical protein
MLLEFASKVSTAFCAASTRPDFKTIAEKLAQAAERVEVNGNGCTGGRREA